MKVKVIDLSFLNEIRDICDSMDCNKIIESYKYYKTRENKLGKKEQIYLKMLQKEIDERKLTVVW